MINEKKEKDKIETVKQKQIEIQKVFENRILPKKNHTLFEINLKNESIQKAIFDDLPEIKWSDAVKALISINKKITKKEDCIYITALNEKNVLKILKRDYNLNYKNDKI